MKVDFFFKDSLENPKYSFLHKENKSPGANKYELSIANKNVHYSQILSNKTQLILTSVD